MAINLNTALNIAKKNPQHFEIHSVYNKPELTNIVRHLNEANGKSVTRIQTFNNKTGELLNTSRRINDKYSIYSEPSSGLFGLQYYTKTKKPKSFFGYSLNRVYVEITPKNLGDIRAFLESQAHNMK